MLKINNLTFGVSSKNSDEYKYKLICPSYPPIASLYRSRWLIEIFFRNLKQRLSIKSFLGTSRNAVEVQIWTALITMLLMVYLKSIAKYPWCLSNLVSSLRTNTFTKIDLMQWLNEPFTPPPETENQLF